METRRSARKRSGPWSRSTPRGRPATPWGASSRPSRTSTTAHPSPRTRTSTPRCTVPCPPPSRTSRKAFARRPPSRSASSTGAARYGRSWRRSRTLIQGSGVRRPRPSARWAAARTEKLSLPFWATSPRTSGTVSCRPWACCGCGRPARPCGSCTRPTGARISAFGCSRAFRVSATPPRATLPRAAAGPRPGPAASGGGGPRPRGRHLHAGRLQEGLSAGAQRGHQALLQLRDHAPRRSRLSGQPGARPLVQGFGNPGAQLPPRARLVVRPRAVPVPERPGRGDPGPPRGPSRSARQSGCDSAPHAVAQRPEYQSRGPGEPGGRAAEAGARPGGDAALSRRPLAEVFVLLLLSACKGQTGGSPVDSAAPDPLAEARQLLQQGQAEAALARLQGASDPEALGLQGRAWAKKAEMAPLPTPPALATPLPRRAAPPAAPEFKFEELQAIDCFERAVAAKPDLAAAHLALAEGLGPPALAHRRGGAANPPPPPRRGGG